MAAPLAQKSDSEIAAASSRIATAKTIAVVLPELPRDDLASAAAALVIALKKAGKVITTFAPPHLAPSSPNFADAFADGEPLRELVISFDVTKSPVRELRYERDAERLDILLSPLSAPLRREDIVFRHGSLRYDLALTIGVVRPEAALANLERAPELLHEKPIINIDTDPENSSFGEVNLLLPEASFAELITQLLEALGIALADPPVPSLLLSSLAAATKNLALPEMTAARFLLAGTLFGAGATLPTQSVFAPPGPVEQALVHLAGRSLARARFVDGGRSALLLIRHEDFSATAMTIGDLAEAARIASRALPSAYQVFVAAETNNIDRSIRLALETRDSRLAGRLVRDSRFQENDGIFVSHETFRNTEDALAPINELLRETQRVE